MQITSYPIRQMLKNYNRQMNRSRLYAKAPGGGNTAGRVNVSAEGKRQVIVDKVAGEIAKRIMQNGPSDKFERELVTQLEAEVGRWPGGLSSGIWRSCGEVGK